MDVKIFVIIMIWMNGDQIFIGVLFSVLLDVLGVDSGIFSVSVINDYIVEIFVEDEIIF